MARRSYRQKKNFRKYRGNYSWNTYKKSSSVVSRAWRSIREANKSNSALDFAFKINYAFSVMYSGEGEGGNRGVAVINIYDVLQKSENFQNMAKSWDQVKINGVTVKLNITDGSTTFSDANSFKTVNICTGWDRTGITPGTDANFENNETSSGDPPVVTYDIIDRDDWDDNAATHFSNTIGKRITEGYGAKKGLLNQYQRFNRYESLFPETLDEKCCYVSCGNINDYVSGYNNETGRARISGDYSAMSVMAQLSSPNPAIPFENPGIKWKPTLLVGAFRTTVGQAGEITQYGAVSPIIFNGEFTIPVTFKGQKGDR